VQVKVSSSYFLAKLLPSKIIIDLVDVLSKLPDIGSYTSECLDYLRTISIAGITQNTELEILLYLHKFPLGYLLSRRTGNVRFEFVDISTEIIRHKLLTNKVEELYELIWGVYI
jgi:hypothetical protein